jgi:cold shock CspA family protein
MNGTISRMMIDKRYGFIKSDEDRRDYFFHSEDCVEDFDDLANIVDSGQRVKVSFDSVPSPKGPRAGNVARIEE